jgi:SAM-dependent methyltransferase
MINNLLGFKRSVERYSGKKISIHPVVSDILDFKTKDRFDLIFSNGVLEHFMDKKTRIKVIRKLEGLTRPGGVIVTGIPNGKQPYRKRFKNEKLGGYDVPEIDYDCKSLISEFKHCSVRSIRVEGFNVFGYWESLPELRKYSLIIRPVYIFFRLLEPLLPRRMKLAKGHWLICTVRMKNE